MQSRRFGERAPANCSAAPAGATFRQRNQPRRGETVFCVTDDHPDRDAHPLHPDPPMNATSLALCSITSMLPQHPDAPQAPHLAMASWQHQRLLDEQGHLPVDALHTARAWRQGVVATTGSLDDGGLSPTNWTSIGPDNYAGRTRGLAANGTNLIAGSAGGGLWRSSDAGASWTPVDDHLGNLNIACIARADSTPQVLYAGTGEVERGYTTALGAGIWKSTDGGATWAPLAGTVAFGQTVALSVHPQQTAVVLAGTTTGVWRSADAGASWARVHTAICQQVAFGHGANPVAGAILELAQGTSFLRSTDQGLTWNAGASPFYDVTRGTLRMGWDPTTTTNVVLLRGLSSGLGLMHASTDAGNSFGGSVYPSMPGWSWDRFAGIWIEPGSTGPATMYFGSEGLQKAIGLGTPMNLSNGDRLVAPAYGVHLIVGDPSVPGRGYVGTEDGVYRADSIATATAAAGWLRISSGYRTSTFRSIAVDATGRLVGGTQGLGWLQLANGSAQATSFGQRRDYGPCTIDATSPNLLYAMGPNLSLERSSNGTSSTEIGVTHSTLVQPEDFGVPLAPFALDPADGNYLYAGGLRLYRTTNGRSPAPSWLVAKQVVSDGTTNRPVSAVAVSPHDGARLWVGHDNGWLYTTGNGHDFTPTWTRVGTGVLPGRYIERILVDPTASNRVLVAFGGYSPDNLWETTDGGTTWVARSGSGNRALPAAPVRALVFHPYATQVLYVGTDVGVFASEDGGAMWSAGDEGPTDAPVTDLQWQPGTTILHLATTGRGLWSAFVGTGSVVDLGPGCAGTAGTPLLAATTARFGRSSTITVTNLPPSTAGWMAQGTSATSWFGNPLPFSLAGFGAPGCWLRTSLDWLRDAGSSAAGSFSTTLPIANDPALVDTEFCLQYFVHDPGANGMGKVTSNTLRLQIGF